MFEIMRCEVKECGNDKQANLQLKIHQEYTNNGLPHRKPL